jgi:hypothetical protein
MYCIAEGYWLWVTSPVEFGMEDVIVVGVVNLTGGTCVAPLPGRD